MTILDHGAQNIMKRSMEQSKILKKEHWSQSKSRSKKKNENGGGSREKLKKNSRKNHYMGAQDGKFIEAGSVGGKYWKEQGAFALKSHYLEILWKCPNFDTPPASVIHNPFEQWIFTCCCWCCCPVSPCQGRSREPSNRISAQSSQSNADILVCYWKHQKEQLQLVSKTQH